MRPRLVRPNNVLKKLQDGGRRSYDTFTYYIIIIVVVVVGTGRYGLCRRLCRPPSFVVTGGPCACRQFGACARTPKANRIFRYSLNNNRTRVFFFIHGFQPPGRPVPFIRSAQFIPVWLSRRVVARTSDAVVRRASS